jgi:diacylglycerol kinase (ATP)
MVATIALIAHDRKKDDIVAFAQKYQHLLSRYRIIATGTTGERIQAATTLTVDCKLSGALGGDAQIAAEVVTGGVAGVVFLIDPLFAQPHEPDIRALLRLCEVHNVLFATNLATAEAILARLATLQSAYLIFNPVAGQGNPVQALSTIRELLQPHMHLTVHTTTPEDDVETLARSAIEAGTDMILASGGDGTVSAAAAAVIGTGIPLGVIPRGTANAFSVALGIPRALQAACQTIVAGITRTVDAARCNGSPMILLAGIGFEAETVERANRDLKNRIGALAYLLAGVQQFSQQEQFQTHIEVDGKVSEFQAGAITIANVAPPTSVLAQGFGQVITDDGLLDVTIGTANTRLQAIDAMLNLFGAALIKSAPNREDIICLRTQRLTVTTDPPQKVVVDGEIIGTTPIEVECIPGGLVVFAPPATEQPTREETVSDLLEEIDETADASDETAEA